MTVPSDPSRQRALTHDRLIDRFDELMDGYDLARRTEVLVGEFLHDDLKGKLRRLRRILEGAGARVAEHRGVHLWPFQIKAMRPMSRWVDRFGSALLPFMINQCIHARKPL